MTTTDLMALGIALGLGLLVGMQRERYHSRIAGIRTFTLITLLGSVTGLMAREFAQGWIVAAGGLAIAWLLGVANFLKRNEDDPDIGQTTEIAALLMYSIGAYLIIGTHLIGVVLGAVVALLLYLKQYLSTIVNRLGEKDLQAIMLFVAISLVILPILPNNNFGPYEILNLREIWLMVVLIVGLSIVGYFAYKWLGKDMGTGLNGILGGLISSTATTVTYAKQAKGQEGVTRVAGFIIMAAATVAFIRIILEISVVAPKQLNVVAPPLIVLTIFMAIISAVLFFYNKQDHQDIHEPENPAQFKTALIFALLYAGILLVVAFVKNEIGQEGLYVIAIISGLTDMDAITLSLSNMMNNGRIDATMGWHLILLAALSNLVFKAGIVVVLGNRQLTKIVCFVFGLTLIAGGLVWVFWDYWF